MRFSLTQSSLTAMAVIGPVIAQSTTADFNTCIFECNANGAPVSSCLVMDPEHSSCYCRPETTRPDAEAAACVKNCSSILDMDYTELFDETCDELFETPPNDGDSNDEEASATDDDPSPSQTGESIPDESPDAAVARGASMLIAAGGLLAVFFL